MYKNSPKLILRVDIIGETDLKFMLILLDKYYSDHYIDRNTFLSHDGFTIYRGNLFTVFKTGSLHLPKNFSIGSNKAEVISFTSDKERYDYLKRMNKALLEWSNSNFWSGFAEDAKIKLTYRNHVWVLF